MELDLKADLLVVGFEPGLVQHPSEDIEAAANFRAIFTSILAANRNRRHFPAHQTLQLRSAARMLFTQIYMEGTDLTRPVGGQSSVPHGQVDLLGVDSSCHSPHRLGHQFRRGADVQAGEPGALRAEIRTADEGHPALGQELLRGIVT